MAFSSSSSSDSDKKIHQSWGGDDGNAEFKVEEAATVDAAAEGAANDTGDAWGATDAADAWAAPAAEGEAALAAPAVEGDRGDRRRREREPEEEDNTLTLDQYLAQKKEQEDSLVPKLDGTRKANDGADSWKDVVPLEKAAEDTYFVGKVRSYLFLFISVLDIHANLRAKQYPKLGPRRKKRSLSKSRLVSTVLLVEVHVVVVVVVNEVLEELAVVVEEATDLLVAVELHQPSMSMIRPLSHRCLDLHYCELVLKNSSGSISSFHPLPGLIYTLIILCFSIFHELHLASLLSPSP